MAGLNKEGFITKSMTLPTNWRRIGKEIEFMIGEGYIKGTDLVGGKK
jgi:hypothetical protein